MNLKNVIDSNDPQKIADFLIANGLTMEEDAIVAPTEEVKQYCKAEHERYDQRQLIQKILLNS